MVDQEPERARQPFDVAGPHQQPGLARSHRLARAGDVRRHHGEARRHGLEHGPRDALAERHQRGDVGVREHAVHILAAAEERHRALEPELGDTCFVLAPQRALAHELQTELRTGSSQRCRSGEQHVVVLDRLEPRHAGDGDAFARRTRRGDEAPDVDAVANPVAVAARADAVAMREPQLLVVLRQQHVGDAAAQLLDRQRRAARDPRARLVEVEAVYRVHHHRHAGEPRRDAADHARNRAVGVDQVYTLAHEVRP
jgi:hypothetical protein